MRLGLQPPAVAKAKASTVGGPPVLWHGFGSRNRTACHCPPQDRISSRTAARKSNISAEYSPCLKALRLPLGAPGDKPPCILHRPLGIAGDWHTLALRVRAPQRIERCIGMDKRGKWLCMGLILVFDW